MGIRGSRELPQVAVVVIVILASEVLVAMAPCGFLPDSQNNYSRPI